MKQIYYKRKGQTISRKLKNKLALLDPDKGRFLTLNETAAKLWQSLWRPRTINNMEEILVKEYQVGKKQLKRDLNEFISKMMKLGLIKKIDGDLQKN